MDNNTEGLNAENKNESYVNLKGYKDAYLENGTKRILIVFKKNGEAPTVINIDPNMNLVDEINRRQSEYAKYQGINAIDNTERILNDLAKESASLDTIRPLDASNLAYLKTKYTNDPDRLKKIIAVVDQASKMNASGELKDDEKYAYYDEEKDCIISKTGKVLEAKIDTLRNNATIQSAEQSEYRDEEIGDDGLNSGTLNTTRDTVEADKPTSDSEFSDKDIEEVYEEVTYGMSNIDEAVVKDKLKEMAEDPTEFFKEPLNQEQFYYDAYEALERRKAKSKTLTYTPDDTEKGASNYLYIAIFVLLIAFAVLMYFVFKR